MSTSTWIRTLAASCLVGISSACGSTNEVPKAAVSSDVPLPDVESMTEFAGRYLGAMESGNQTTADELTCDGESTLFTVINGVTDGNWQIGDKITVDRHDGFAEIQETVGDNAIGLQAKFRNGEWCAIL